ncbi:MAG: enoyl-CoA hydratase-related protein, partial [Planctomycetota bacterium JB042]
MSEPTAVRIEVDDGVARVVLDVPDASMNVLSVAVLEELDRAVATAAATSGVRAIVLRGGKESGFCAGADVDGIADCRDREEGRRAAAFGQEVFGRIERSNVPVVAAVHGPCLGGGLEMALACRGLIASHEPKTRLGLPEVLLGIVPGFGGTQRLSRRVGVAKALNLILTGRMLSAKRALSAGVVDDIVCPFKLDEEARRYALELAGGGERRNGKRRGGWMRWLDRKPLRSFVLAKARRDVEGRTRGVFPAPLRAIDLIDRAFEPDRIGGYRAEAEAVGELLELDVTHHLVDLFRRREALRKAAGDTEGVGAGDVALVVGAGVMGAAIARAFLKKRVEVRLVDVSSESLRKGVEGIAQASARDVRRGRIGRHEAARALDGLRAGVGLEAVSRAT